VNTVLELRSLTKQFTDHRAVDGISLSIERGEFFSLLGPSGCGKTTTLRLVAGFEEPTSGDILLDGQSVVDLPAYRRNVGTVFQNYALFPHLSVFENVAFGLARRRPAVPMDQIRQKVDEILRLMQLKGKERRKPSEISGGEKQRVALARSLVLEPQVLLLDEPLSALDPKLRKQMRIELKELQRRVGITFLFITHDEEEALSLSDRMAVMNRGVIEQVGTPREVYTAPTTLFVAEFLGGVNWVKGAGVRPEAVRLSRKKPRLDEHRSLEGVVTGTTFLGHCVHVHATLENGMSCVVESTGRVTPFVAGETVYVWWHPRDELPVAAPRKS
jgi:spermidine/putrescine transport system ATP-binding protein